MIRIHWRGIQNVTLQQSLHIVKHPCRGCCSCACSEVEATATSAPERAKTLALRQGLASRGARHLGGDVLNGCKSIFDHDSAETAWVGGCKVQGHSAAQRLPQHHYLRCSHAPHDKLHTAKCCTYHCLSTRLAMCCHCSSTHACSTHDILDATMGPLRLSSDTILAAMKQPSCCFTRGT